MQIINFITSIIFLSVFHLSKTFLYLSHTRDGSEIELYDCFTVHELSYCIRPRDSTDLNRNHGLFSCDGQNSWKSNIDSVIWNLIILASVLSYIIDSQVWNKPKMTHAILMITLNLIKTFVNVEMRLFLENIVNTNCLSEQYSTKQWNGKGGWE